MTAAEPACDIARVTFCPSWRGHLWGWTTLRGMGKVLQGPACPLGAKTEGSATVAVVCPFTQQPRVLPGHCSHPFLLRQMGHLAWPCPDLGLRREPHGRAKDLFTVCRRPLFHNCRAVSDPADPPDPKGGLFASSSLGLPAWRPEPPSPSGPG